MLLALTLAGTSLATLALSADLYMTLSARSRIHARVLDCPQAPVGLVLGVAKRSGTRLNQFYEARIDAAAELFHAGRVRGLLVSGDHGRVEYNEPATEHAQVI